MQEQDLVELRVVNAGRAVIGLKTMQGQVLKVTERAKTGRGSMIGLGATAGPRPFIRENLMIKAGSIIAPDDY